MLSLIQRGWWSQCRFCVGFDSERVVEPMQVCVVFDSEGGGANACFVLSLIQRRWWN